RQLIAEGFSGACGEHGEHAVPCEQGPEHLQLVHSERPVPEACGQQLAGTSEAAGKGGHGAKKTGPGRKTGAQTSPRWPELRAIRPVHRVCVAALEALHLLRLARRVLAFVALGTYEMRLGDDAPGLLSTFPHTVVSIGDPYFDLVDVEDHPRLAGVLHDAVPRAAAVGLRRKASAAARGTASW